jgi:anthranilate phosphoribosyltransferase
MFGIKKCMKEDLTGGTPEENAKITRLILSGEKGPKRDAVVLNSAAAFYIAGKCSSVSDGVAIARNLIDSGKSEIQLNAFITRSNKI